MTVPPFDRSSSTYSSSSSNNNDDDNVQSNTSSKQFQMPDRRNNTQRKQDDNRGNKEDSVFNISKKDPKKDDKLHDSKKKSDTQADSLITGLKEKNEKEEKERQAKEDEMFGASLGELMNKVELTGAGAGGVDAIEGKDLSKVVDMIQKMVAQLATGTAGGQTVTSLQLKGTDVPEVFADSTIELTQTADGALTIKFTGFATPQQEAQAIQMIEKDKEALTRLATSLQAKNINVAELQVGTHMVNMPRTDVPFVFQPPASAESQQQQRDREGEGQNQRERRQKRDEDEES